MKNKFVEKFFASNHLLIFMFLCICLMFAFAQQPHSLQSEVQNKGERAISIEPFKLFDNDQFSVVVSFRFFEFIVYSIHRLVSLDGKLEEKKTFLVIRHILSPCLRLAIYFVDIYFMRKKIILHSKTDFQFSSFFFLSIQQFSFHFSELNHFETEKN